MDSVVKKYLQSFNFTEGQFHKNMAVFPLLCELNHDPEYLTLKEALDSQVLKIVEVSQAGSVPELKVVNEGEKPVLLLDGEEVVGAKQNRVLNTSILISGQAETVIPVSCTEQGRWAYKSEKFADSDTLMSTKLRRIKAKTVSDTLHESREYRSDQGTVWTAIEEMADAADAPSETGAMRDVFAAKTEELDEYLKAFTLIPNQRGLLAMIDREVVGFDFVSLESAYKLLHAKLVKSYAMDALLHKEGSEERPPIEEAQGFLAQTLKCKEKKYESVGRGSDYRYEGEKLVGSALKVDKKVIHAAFFMISESEKTGDIATSRRRSRFRL
jgi:hypothetical protein